MKAIIPIQEIEELYPINIGSWHPYNIFIDEEQKNIQLENLIILPLENKNGPICFIYTKELDKYLSYINNISDQVQIQNTETIIRDETYYTCKIEGANTTRVRTSEIHNGLPIDKNNEYSERMVQNHFNAVKLLNLSGIYLSETHLVRVWNVLIDNCCQNEEIRGDKYRNGPCKVGNYTPVEHTKIEQLMNKWLNFYNSSILDDKPFLKAALLHFTFETIHPFPDGNGRMGRLLINHYLISRNIENARAVSFSMEIDKNRSKYDVSFIDSENEYNDCTPHLHYMVEVFANSYHHALEVQNNKDYDMKPI